MSPSKMRHGRRGLTLVNVVIVMAIIFVLVALLLPASQRGREVARRTNCRHNLRQMGLALQNYHDTYNCFPAGYELTMDGAYTGWGWSVRLLPYLDSISTYEKFNFQRGLQHESDKHHMNAPLRRFHCTTDSGSPLVPHLALVTSGVTNGVVVPATADFANVFPRSNYFGVAGYLPAEFGGIERADLGETFENAGRLGHAGRSFSPDARYCDQHSFRGAFGQNSSVKMDDIKDGASNVLIVGERYTPTNSSRRSVGHGTWLGVPDCSTSAGLAAALGDTSVKLNLGAKKRADTTGFGSPHVGGSHFLYGDGAVRRLGEKISITTYRDLSTIDDGREVGEF